MKIRIYVFIILFFNTGIIMMIVGANLENKLPYLGKFFNGKYVDFTS